MNFWLIYYLVVAVVAVLFVGGGIWLRRHQPQANWSALAIALFLAWIALNVGVLPILFQQFRSMR